VSKEKDKQRSFNYEIQLVTSNDCIMILKNTSSSGQKVLSSIVIRLALAEFFGSNCGIFALDEPTNHLDDANKESLALFLKRLAD
jgi:DNA repair protein RAD50